MNGRVEREAGETRLAPGARGAKTALRTLVGVAALVAPALHSGTDLYELMHGGFTPPQLWVNYLAFLPMSWLLVGLYAVDEGRPPAAGLAGAVLYGAAFTYFAHSTLYALLAATPTYDELWRRLGGTYTVHGALMVAGGLLGRVEDIGESVVSVELAQGLVVKVQKHAIAAVLPKGTLKSA